MSFIPVVERWIADKRAQIERQKEGTPYREMLEKQLAEYLCLLKDLREIRDRRQQPQKDLPLEPREPGAEG